MMTMMRVTRAVIMKRVDMLLMGGMAAGRRVDLCLLVEPGNLSGDAQGKLVRVRFLRSFILV